MDDPDEQASLKTKALRDPATLPSRSALLPSYDMMMFTPQLRARSVYGSSLTSLLKSVKLATRSSELQRF